MQEQRKGDWMQTATGKAFWPADPRPDEVCIHDIGHALANICRYGGHCREFYSVAQHSVLVCRALPPKWQLWGLLHDASEAYVADVPRPLKLFLPNYRELEDGVMSAITTHFGLDPEMPAEVKRVDNAILATEAEQIMLTPPRAWRLPEPPLNIRIEPWSATSAFRVFMQEFERLS